MNGADVVIDQAFGEVEPSRAPASDDAPQPAAPSRRALERATRELLRRQAQRAARIGRPDVAEPSTAPTPRAHRPPGPVLHRGPGAPAVAGAARRRRRARHPRAPPRRRRHRRRRPRHPPYDDGRILTLGDLYLGMADEDRPQHSMFHGRVSAIEAVWGEGGPAPSWSSPRTRCSGCA
ncbi:MAG: hypothetical protein R3F59_05135 [Myxococcota bacterium]